MHDASIMGRILATCGWLTWRASLGRTLTMAAALALFVVASVPLIVPHLDPQPDDVTVQRIFDSTVEHSEGWVRLTGRVVPLADSPTGERGVFALLVDAVNPLRSIVIQPAARPAATARATVTGHLRYATVEVTEDLPIEATVAGTPPRIVPHQVVVLDSTPKPARDIWWPLAVPPALLGAMLLVGSRTGYPVFRPTRVVDVLSSPLAVSERVPVVFGGRVGQTQRTLLDPGSALLLVHHGERGNLLTVQPMADHGGLAPPPVTIGGGWTSGRIGSLHTLTETVPALVVRSELIDATFLFARAGERDRAARLVSVAR